MSQLEIAESNLRAAHAALSERDRLRAQRITLADDLAKADELVAKLAAAHSSEQQDVKRYEKGVWAFLYDIVADRQERLSKERREAEAAGLKLDDGVAFRDRLKHDLTNLDTRLAQLAKADTELTVARAGKQAVIVAMGGARADELETVARDLGLADDEGKALDEALQAGGNAHGSMARLVAALGSARSWGTFDMLTDSTFISLAKRGQIDQAQMIASEAQANLAAFRRELGDVGLSIVNEMGDLALHHRFLDVWFDNIFSDWSVQDRIVKALASAEYVLEEVGKRLEELRRRRSALLTRSEALSRRRIELIEGV